MKIRANWMTTGCAMDILLGYCGEAIFGGCSRQYLTDQGSLMTILTNASEKAGLTTVAQACHAFGPFGITCVLILAQPHLIAHSWPEHETLVVDIFTRGPADSLE